MMNNSSLMGEIERHSDGFKKPTIISGGALPLSISEDTIISMLSNLSSLPEELIKTFSRVYVGTGLDRYMGRRLLSSAYQIKDPLSDWFSGKCEQRKVCLIINGTECLNEHLAEQFGRLCKYALERNKNDDVPAFELTTFIGDYGFTPFGVHLDEAVSDILHFHLGPGDKSFYLWEPEVIEQMSLSVDEMQFPSQDLLETAKTYRVHPGDVFILPPNLYHVAYTHGFSVGIAFVMACEKVDALIHESVCSAAENLLSNVTTEKVQLTEEGITQLVPESVQLHNWIEKSVVSTIYKRKSRLSFRGSPIETQITVTPDSYIKKTEPFSIYYRTHDSKLSIYCRGYEMSLPRRPSIIELIDALNTGQDFYVKNLIKRFSGTLSEPALLFLLNYLVRHRGVTRLEEHDRAY